NSEHRFILGALNRISLHTRIGLKTLRISTTVCFVVSTVGVSQYRLSFQDGLLIIAMNMSDKSTSDGLTDDKRVHDAVPPLSTPDASECTSVSSTSSHRSNQAESEESSELSLPILELSSSVESSYEDNGQRRSREFDDTSETTTQSIYGLYVDSDEWIDSGYSTSILESTTSSKSWELTD
ncbi:hypothetical protein M514_02547, partial [Trichuris suis]